MVGEMVQNPQSLYSFTFNVVIIIHEYIYSHSAAKFIFKRYTNSHLTTYFVFTNILTHIYGMYSFTFNGLYSFTFTITFTFSAHRLRASLGPSSRSTISERNMADEGNLIIWRGRTKTNDPKHTQLNINITWVRGDNRLLDDFGWTSR